jgi:thiamine pyrophosphokinase
VDGDTRIFLLRGGEKLSLEGRKGDLLSLLPLGDSAEGIKGEGVFYPLDNLSLSLGHALGMSNVFTQEKIWVSLETGKLLVIQTKGELT